ncbi:MAG: GHMP kinase [Euryarchaeota archaeon]|nr:GHMP kinase [Euryarchaeota archaeon]|tara:strand:+ start:314 stop:1279 length:966 start_codon:yes stop_codon:yes gene_type:complete
MIVSRTPLRVSFCGGGSDLEEYYSKSKDGGCVTSVALKKHIYVTVNSRFDDSVRVSYSEMEIVDDFENLKHQLVKEAMRITGVTKGVEITTIADIPSKGSGLGSSSAVTVGLLHALHCFAGRKPDAKQLAEEACEIEINILGQTIGKQDQYAAAYGGCNHIIFNQDGTVIVENLSHEFSLKENFALLYTGITRSANEILSEQNNRTKENKKNIGKLVDQAKLAKKMIIEEQFGELANLLNDAWLCKRELSPNISNEKIDLMFEKLSSCGVNGAKLLGAGGGGYILFVGDSNVMNSVKSTFQENKIIPLEIDFEGSCILYAD